MAKALVREDFLYISSRLKALENNNLTREKYEKMIEAKSISDAVGTLLEAGYSNGDDGTDNMTYEKLFTAELAKEYALIEKISPDPDIVYFFKYQYDCHNLKSLIKSEMADTVADSLLIELGNIPVKEAKPAVRNRNYTVYGRNMADAAERAVELYAQNSDPMLIDVTVDGGYYRDLYGIALRSEHYNDFLKNIVKYKIDITNILSEIRLIRMKYSLDLLKKVILPNGNFTPEFFAENFDLTEAKLIDALKYTRFGKLQELYSSGKNEIIPLRQIEKFLEESFNEEIYGTRLIPYGPEVVISYIIKKETEIKNARIILSGKEADISGDSIRERVRNL